VSLLRRLAVLPIRAYQRFLSPLKPPTCRFHPTCSQYAAEATLRHGLFKGPVLAVWRILRCQPFSREGPDPVPPRGDWRMPFRRGYRAPLFEAAPPGDEPDPDPPTDLEPRGRDPRMPGDPSKEPNT